MKKDNALENAYAKLRPVFQSKLKGRILYHYTTLSTFDAFLKDDAQLVCTHYAALNDDSEIKCGFNLACEYLQNTIGIASTTCQQLKECFEVGRSTEMINPSWIMSFSLEADSLYQWGMYTDRHRGGYSIGFDSDELRKLVDDSNERNGRKGNPSFTMNLLPCLYAESDKSVIQQFLSMVFNPNSLFLTRLKKNGLADASAASTVLADMVLVSCLIKHESFKYENEVRLIVNPSFCDYESVDLIGGKPRWNTRLFPRCGNPLRSDIKEVWVSPHGDRQLLRDVAEMMKRKHGLSFGIKASKSPYNGR